MYKKKKCYGSGGIRTHASEETGALNQRLRPLGHATFLTDKIFILCNFSKKQLYKTFNVSMEYFYIWGDIISSSIFYGWIWSKAEWRSGSVLGP